MKGKKGVLISLILCGIIGWTFGYLRMPFINKNFSLLIGFATGLAIVLLGIILLFVWNKHPLLFKLFDKESTTKDSSKASRNYILIWILASVFIVLGGLLCSFLIFKQNEQFSTHLQDQQKKIEQQSELIESIRNSNQIFLMGNLLDKIDDELKNNPQRTLSNETIARIVALGYSFKPYKYLEGDSLSVEKFSPERGQLLLVLCKMNIDSSSFAKIKLKTPFSQADLRGVDLRGADLSGADLEKAQLKDADLRWANLKRVNLKHADLWGANLKRADLKEADLKRADLRWADLNETDLREADLNGVDLSSATLRKADLRGADLKYAKLYGTILNGANLTGIDLSGTSLKRANLSKANLSKANLYLSNISEAILTGSNLSKANLNSTSVEEKNWLEKLPEWQVTGAKEIQENYKIGNDISVRANFRLKKIEE